MPTPLDIAYLTALGLASPWVARRLLVSKKGRTGLLSKLTGRVNVQPKTRTRVWFHAVSVGEVHLLRSVLSSLSVRRPDCEIVVSSSTDTGQSEAIRLFPTHIVIPAPLDLSWSLRETMHRIQPDLIVLAESELWPGLLLAAEHAGIPVVVINGRLSPNSARRWKRFAPVAKAMFHRVSHFGVQSHNYCDNLRSLGIEPSRMTVTGSVKYDGVETNRKNSSTQLLRAQLRLRDDAVVWVAGSTQAPEESGILSIYSKLKVNEPRLRLIIVPRQKERFDEVARLIQASQWPLARRSQLLKDVADESIILVDTIGELRHVWGLADIAFVGGSLDGKRGGQNMIEPAAYGAAVTFGPHTWNFRTTVEQLLSHTGAIEVPDFLQLEAAMRKLLDAKYRTQLGVVAQAFVLSQQGATDRTIDLIVRFLPKQRLAA